MDAEKLDPLYKWFGGAEELASKVEIVHMDLEDDDSIDKAVEGIQRAVLCISAPDRLLVEMLRCLHVHHGRWSSILHLFLRLISFLFFGELVLRLSYM